MSKPMYPFVLLAVPILAATGCSTRIPSALAEPVARVAAVPLPGHFIDRRPADEKTTSIRSGKQSTVVSYGDDIEPNAKDALLARLRHDYPDNLSGHRITLRKIELVSIFRTETPSYFMTTTGQAQAAMAQALVANTFLAEKYIYLNIVADIDDTEFVGWAHERCRLCSADTTLAEIIRRGTDKAMASLAEALRNRP